MDRKLDGPVITCYNMSIKTPKAEMLHLTQEKDDLKEYVLKLECQSRRDNLVFDGIPEMKGETDFD